MKPVIGITPGIGSFENRGEINFSTKGEVRDAVETALAGLDEGRFRVAERAGDDWQVNQWLKKAVLLSFRLNDMSTISGGPGGASWWEPVAAASPGCVPDGADAWLNCVMVG